MRPTKYSQKAILDILYREKVLTKKKILQMSGCSTMTAWRILTELPGGILWVFY
jgi:hypothetical protein